MTTAITTLIVLLVGTNAVTLFAFVITKDHLKRCVNWRDFYRARGDEWVNNAHVATRQLAALRDDIGHERAERIVREREAA